MKQKHDGLTAYVIHARPFRETSLLLELFTENLGRLSAIAKGAYRSKSPTRPLLQCFNFLQVNLQGQSELLNVTQVERAEAPYFLSGQAVVCGLYLNELLYATLHRHDPHPVLFQAYHHTLLQLAQDEDPKIILRQFELVLLEELGYGIHFAELDEACYYRYDPKNGFQVLPDMQEQDKGCFSGKILLSIAAQQWQIPEVTIVAKHLTRLALAPLLAGKTIHARELFI